MFEFGDRLLFIQPNGLRVLPDKAGSEYSPWKLIEALALDRLKKPHTNASRFRYLFK